MDRDELEENEDSGLNDENSETSNTGNTSDENSSENAPATEMNAEKKSSSPMSLIQQAVMLWKKIPPSLKGTIYTVLFYVIIALLLLFGIIFIVTAATSVTEELWESMHNVGDSVDVFMEKAGNFFTGNGFVTNEEEAEKDEKKYYEKLKEVYDYYLKRLGVEIDTTMITATLFYGRGMSDYVDDEEINNIEDAEDILNEDGRFNDEDIYQGEADFYKLARRQIRTLAKFQIVEETQFNTCPDTVEPQGQTMPESAKDVADTWTGFFGWNTRATFNYQPYEDKAFSKIDGSARTIKWCEFKEAEPQLEAYYNEDYLIYKSYEDAYNNCKTECENLNGTQTWDPHTNQMVTNTCKVETACGSAKEKEEEYLEKLKTKWGDVYDIGEDPGAATFNCAYSDTWDTLTDYNDYYRKLGDERYKNYSFPEDWIYLGTEPSFWATTLAKFTGEFEEINCSAKPSLKIEYKTDLTREGVYYYKLLSPNQQFLSNKSFIEKYYPEFISDESEEEAYEDAVEIVEEIFDLYDYVSERETENYCLYNGQSGTSIGSGTGTGTSYSSESVEEFIEMIAPTVVQDMQKTAVLSSVTIAQAILESTHGTSGLTTKYNNYYGETVQDKCTSNVDKSIKGAIPPGTNNNTCKGNKYWDGTIVRMCNKDGEDCQWYRVYNGFENSTNDHSEEFLRTNFSYCDSYLSDARAYVSCLVERPNHKYATDPNYVEKVMSLINDYNLTQYDIGAPSSSTLESLPNSTTATNQLCIPTGFGTSFGSMGTIPGSGIQGIRTQLYGTAEYNTYWGSNNNLFYSSGYVKECTWYAHGRGLEILTKNGMSLATAQKYMNVMYGDAGKWYGQNQYFSSSSDYTKPKVGAIVVWSNGAKKGHVAVIEDIKYDASGNIVSIAMSEGGQSINGFLYTDTRDLEYIKAHRTYKFIGYIYLLD